MAMNRGTIKKSDSKYMTSSNSKDDLRYDDHGRKLTSVESTGNLVSRNRVNSEGVSSGITLKSYQ